MIDVLLAEDVRRQDEQAAARGIPVSSLMQNAGWAVARAARAMLGGTYGRRVVVVCGKGNNAGDGLVAARVLRDQGAHAVAVLVDQDLSGLAAENLAMFRGRVVSLDALARELARADLVIDAIFGVGLSRAPAGAYAEAIAACTGVRAPVLSVDVPSGVVADTGAVPGNAVAATVTVTFGGWKPGLLFMPGASRAGLVEVADIGVPRGLGTAARALERADVRALMPVRARGDHKRRSGTVLVVAGSRAMPGAAALVAAAAVHAGAGLTTLLAPEEVCKVVVARVPEITTIPAPETGDGTIDLKAMEVLRPRLKEFHAIALGPGLTTQPSTVEFVRALLGEVVRPVVLDADGINAFAGKASLLRARASLASAGIGCNLVMTPHTGELARLLGARADELDADRLAAAARACDELGEHAVVVFKGPGTVIAGPPQVRAAVAQARGVRVNTTGGPALAQGGTGDVLTGILASLLAQAAAGGRRATLDLVAAGVWLHGHAADRIAARVAPHPANASALIEEIGRAMHEVCA